MGIGKQVNFRLPKVLLDAVVKRAEEENRSLSSTFRHILETGVDNLLKEGPYEEDKAPAVTFTASEDHLDKARQAAIRNGTSIKAMYTQMLSNELGVMPCLRAAAGTKDEEQE